jgi:hypothetical protein
VSEKLPFSARRGGTLSQIREESSLFTSRMADNHDGEQFRNLKILRRRVCGSARSNRDNKEGERKHDSRSEERENYEEEQGKSQILVSQPRPREPDLGEFETVHLIRNEINTKDKY